jgi:death-on-curing family protein
MVVVINRLCLKWTGGFGSGQSNLQSGANLGFVERIFHNYMYGQTIYPDKYHQAAAYMFYIIKNHVFKDGNKRTGLVTAITFLEWNGIVFSPFDEDNVFEYIMSVAAGENKPATTIPAIATWLRELSLQ